MSATVTSIAPRSSVPNAPVAAQLAKARDDLAKAVTAAKLAAAKRGRLAAEVRALEAEAELEQYRLQGHADRARAEAAEAALAQERAAHLAEERAHAAQLEERDRVHAQELAERAPVHKRGPARRGSGTANGYTTTAAPGDRSEDTEASRTDPPQLPPAAEPAEQ